MKRLRPLVGALLATLILSTAGFADEVEPLVPGGKTELTPPGTDPSKTEPDQTTSTGPSEETPRPSREKGERASSPTPPEQVIQTRHFGSLIELSCAVSDQPNALVVVNHSSEPLPPGTRIKWQLQSEGQQGFFKLLGTLEGGATLVADNVLEGGASGGASCIARII
jgi:hypothetical protein